MIHSDQGWQYQHENYRHMLEKHSLKQSMSRRGNCLDNAAMESFFGTLKSELFYLNSFDSIESLEAGLVEYIQYYNQERIKLKLKGLSPVQYRGRPNRPNQAPDPCQVSGSLQGWVYGVSATGPTPPSTDSPLLLLLLLLLRLRPLPLRVQGAALQPLGIPRGGLSAAHASHGTLANRTARHPPRPLMTLRHLPLRSALLLASPPCRWPRWPATSPAPTRQVPGVYHQRVGALQVTALFDGVVALGRQEVVDVPPTLVSRLLEGRYVPEDKKGLQTAINAFLIRQGNH